MSSLFTAKPDKEGLIGSIFHSVTHVIPWHLLTLVGLSAAATLALTLLVAGPLLVRRMRNPLK